MIRIVLLFFAGLINISAFVTTRSRDIIPSGTETTISTIYPENSTAGSVNQVINKTIFDENGKIICDSSDMLDHRTTTPPRLLVIGLVALLLLIKTSN